MSNHKHDNSEANQAREQCPLCQRQVAKVDIPDSMWPGLCRSCVSTFVAYGTD